MVNYKIAFTRKNLYEGLGKILGVGPGLFTEKDNEFWVTEVALQKLDENGIPYRILVGRRESATKS